MLAVVMATPRMPLLSGVRVLILECGREGRKKSEKQGGKKESGTKGKDGLIRSLPFGGEADDVEGTAGIHRQDLLLEGGKEGGEESMRTITFLLP
jgi:hypothetical protein